MKKFLLIKLATVFLFTALILSASAQVNESNQKNTETDLLLNIIKKVNRDKGVYFLFSDSTIGTRRVNQLYDNSLPVVDILNQILKGTGLSYKKVGEKTFVIIDDRKVSRPIEQLTNVTFNENGISIVPDLDSSFSGKKIIIKGEVINTKDNLPLEGVSVKIKGMQQGVSTNTQGEFSIEIPINATLEVTRVGFTPRSIKVGKNRNLQISLEELYNGMTEVVVVAYGTQKKSTYTGAASNVNLEMVDRAPRSSIQESLQGNVAGVISTNGSGQPGSVPSIRIRGIGSINASSAPLYVVDGIPVVSGDITGYNTNTLAALNSSDIESFVVLKDASATALYGSRGANGVILITTKKGKAGKTRFNFTVQHGINRQGIKEKDKTLNTSEAIQYLREAWVNSGRAPGSFNQELVNRGVDSTQQTDWFKEIMHNGSFLNVDLNISGGTEKSTFYLSGAYYKSEAVQRGVGYDKANLRLNINNKPSSKLSIQGGVGLAYQRSTNSLGGSFFANPIRSMYRLQPWLKVRNDDGSFNTTYNSGYNPVAVIENNFRLGETYYVNANLGATYKFSPAISFENHAAVDFNHGFTQSYSDPRFGNVNVSVGGIAENYTQDIMNWITTSILRYKKDFKLHSIEAFAGYEINKRTDKDQSNTTYQLVPGLQTAANGSLPINASSTITANAVLSSFLNMNYDYDDKYYVTASFRRDGSSRFGRDNRFGNFWSVGAGWNIYKEKFFTVKGITELRLRGSYGATGNQTGIDNFGSLGLYSTGNDYNAVPGYVFNQFENNTLTWEKNYPLNIGVDFAIRKGRLRSTIEYYKRTTKSLLLDVLVPATNGIGSYLDNYGSMSNEGLEISISSTNIQPKKARGVKWITDIMFSANKNRITNINVPIRTDFLNREIGLDFYQWYLVGYAGVDSATGKALWYKNSSEEETTTTFGSASRYNQGSALPKFIGSIKNSVSYKNFTLIFQFYVNWGNKIRDIHGIYTSADGSAGFSATGNISRYNFEHRWRNPGDITDVPAPVYLGVQTGLSNMMSSRFLYDGSYIRLRDLSLSYSIPKALVKKLKLTSSKIYFRSNNLFTWVKDKRLIFDPEVPVGGTLDQRPPVFKTFLLGIDINF